MESPTRRLSEEVETLHCNNNNSVSQNVNTGLRTWRALVKAAMNFPILYRGEFGLLSDFSSERRALTHGLSSLPRVIYFSSKNFNFLYFSTPYSLESEILAHSGYIHVHF